MISESNTKDIEISPEIAEFLIEPPLQKQQITENPNYLTTDSNLETSTIFVSSEKSSKKTTFPGTKKQNTNKEEDLIKDSITNIPGTNNPSSLYQDSYKKTNTETQKRLNITVTEAADINQFKSVKNEKNFDEKSLDLQNKSYGNNKTNAKKLYSKKKTKNQEVLIRDFENSPRAVDSVTSSKSLKSKNKLKIPKKIVNKSLHSEKEKNHENEQHKSSEDDFESEISEFSRYSHSKQIELDQKYSKLSGNSENTNKNSENIKLLKHYLVADLSKKIRYKDPAENFIQNFSYSILKCVNNLYKLNANIQSKGKKKSQRYSEQESDKLNNKQKIVKKPTKAKSKLGQSESNKKGLASKKFYSREIALETALSRNSPQKNVTRRIESIQKKFEKISSSESFSDVSLTIHEGPSRKTLLYELSHQDITIQIAKLMLKLTTINNKDENIIFQSQSLHTESSESVHEVSLEEEIRALSHQINFSNEQFVFSPQVNYYFTQPGPVGIHKFETQDFEIDSENFKNLAEKQKFYFLQRLRNEPKETSSPLRILPQDEMTDKEKYQLRMKKMKKIHKKKAVIKEKPKAAKLKEKTKKKRPKDEILIFKDETYDERIYLRIKNSPSTLIKPTTQVNYLPSDIFNQY